MEQGGRSQPWWMALVRCFVAGFVIFVVWHCVERPSERPRRESAALSTYAVDRSSVPVPSQPELKERHDNELAKLADTRHSQESAPVAPAPGASTAASAYRPHARQRPPAPTGSAKLSRDRTSPAGIKQAHPGSYAGDLTLKQFIASKPASERVRIAQLLLDEAEHPSGDLPVSRAALVDGALAFVEGLDSSIAEVASLRQRTRTTRARIESPTPVAVGYGCAENGSCYGDISGDTGRPKTVRVRGYYRKDGTYVRGHFRSRAR